MLAAMQLVGARRYAVWTFCLTVIALDLGQRTHEVGWQVAEYRLLLTIGGLGALPRPWKRMVPLCWMPQLGSLPQAEAAQLVLLAGGAQEIFLKAKPVLGCIASVVHHVGPQGQGSTMKLAANALLAIQVAAVAETLAALDKSGIAPKRALEIISGLPVMSPA
jgi:hypothetical protein